jgi:hypothetical protein
MAQRVHTSLLTVVKLVLAGQMGQILPAYQQFHRTVMVGLVGHTVAVVVAALALITEHVRLLLVQAALVALAQSVSSGRATHVASDQLVQETCNA